MSQPSVPQIMLSNLLVPEVVIRSRKELSSRDSINAQKLEHWQNDVRQPSYNRPDPNKRPTFSDTLPEVTRLNPDNLVTRHDVHTVHKVNAIEIPSFLSRMNVDGQERNIIREFNSSIHDNTNRRDNEDILRSQIGRTFNNRWQSERVDQETSAVDVQEWMRPKMDDYTRSYR